MPSPKPSRVQSADGSIAFLASDDEARAQLTRAAAELGVDVGDAVEQLAAVEADLLAWLAESDANVQSFVEDPLAALETAGLGLGKKALRAIRSAAEAVEGSLPPAKGPAAPVDPMAAVSVQTKGWDLVAAVNQETLEGLLVEAFKKGMIPSTVTKNIEVPPFGSAEVTVDITAPTLDLNPSQAKGQSGFVGLTLPITSGTIVFNGKSTEIPAGSLEVVTNLAYVHIDAKESGTIDRLSLDFASKLAIYTVVITEPDWEPALTDLLETALKVYFEGLAPATVYLGDVNIPALAAPLAPEGEGEFAIQVAPDPGKNVLLLLITTSGGTKPASTDFSAAPSLVPEGQKSALYVSNRLLIQDLAVPAIASGLGVPASQFAISGSATSPYSGNFSGSYKIPHAEYEPEVKGLSIAVNESGQIQGSYDVHAHPLFNAGSVYYVKVEGHVFATPSLGTEEQVITFKTTADKGTAKIECSAAGWVIVVAAIIASFGTLGAFLAIVLAIVVPILITQLRFPVTLPSSLLDSVKNGLASFTWPLQEHYPLSELLLPGDLVFVGTPTV